MLVNLLVIYKSMTSKTKLWIVPIVDTLLDTPAYNSGSFWAILRLESLGAFTTVATDGHNCLDRQPSFDRHIPIKHIFTRDNHTINPLLRPTETECMKESLPLWKLVSNRPERLMYISSHEVLALHHIRPRAILLLVNLWQAHVGERDHKSFCNANVTC